jgi:hypothetical protein
MLVVPRAFSLMLCERMEVDPSKKGQTSLVGIFNYRRYASYPTPPQHFTVYTVLYDGLGQGPAELRIIHADTLQELYRYQRWSAFATRLHMLHWEIEVTQCVFPAAGRYLFALYVDGDLITDRFVELF